MDNLSMGGFIRELRKEREMTQKQLAERLHITDRAVSKWERGVCAPDLSLLEPLAEVLGVSVQELLEGRRIAQTEEQEGHTRRILAYSRGEITRKVRLTRRACLGVLAGLMAAAVLCGGYLWRSGWFFVTERSAAPRGGAQVTVYRKDVLGRRFLMRDGISVITDLGDGAQWRVSYGDCDFQGLWWAPDGKKYVLALESESGPRLLLSWLEHNSESNLSVYLSMGVEAAELGKNRTDRSGDWPETGYQFLQWGRDSASMQIYYAYVDGTGGDGYFWYNCETGEVSAVLELEQP